MYCPHCGTELPPLTKDPKDYLGKYYSGEAECPKKECSKVLTFWDYRPMNTRSRIEVAFY